MEKLKVYCPYPAWDLGWEILKDLDRITFNKSTCLEYNTDMSAEYPESISG